MREARAQDPPDTLQVIADSVLVDSLEAVLISDSASADTIYYNLPRFEGEAPEGWETGVWSWDRAAIMASSANTLAELVAEVPGVIVLLGGLNILDLHYQVLHHLIEQIQGLPLRDQRQSDQLVLNLKILDQHLKDLHF